jgi:hypothetical protein
MAHTDPITAQRPTYIFMVGHQVTRLILAFLKFEDFVSFCFT